MKINVNRADEVEAALDEVQSAFRAGRLNGFDVAAAAETAERDLAAQGVAKTKRHGSLYRLYARDGSATYAILTRGTARWYLTEVGRVTGVHGPSRLYVGIDRDGLALYDTLGITPDDFADSLSVGTAYITADGVSVEVRRGIGGSAYVASVVGDLIHDIGRHFVDRSSRDLSRSGKTGGVEWGPLSDGIYQAGGFCTAYGDGAHTMSVFFIVRSGQVASLGQRRAAIAKAVSA